MSQKRSVKSARVAPRASADVTPGYVIPRPAQTGSRVAARSNPGYPDYLVGEGDYRSMPRRAPPASRYVSGMGDYSGGGLDIQGLIKDVLKSVNPLLGTAAGLITGFGDYVQPKFAVKQNSILDMGVDPPEVVNTPMRNVIVRHREYLGDIFCGSSGVFTIQGYPIQPGNSLTFPWLSAVAGNFEQYRLRGCVFEFKSTSGDALNSTNTALGTVIMATQYDVTKPAFANKMQIENHQYAMSAKPSYSMMHPIECDRTQSPIQELYIRQDDYQPANYDPKLYDFGTFYIASYGMQSSTPFNLGELWVTFEVELIKPVMLQAGPSSIATGHYTNNTGITTSAYFGTVASVTTKQFTNLKAVFTTNTVTLPDIDSGSYLAIYAVYGTSAALTGVNPSYTNASALSIWDGTTYAVVSQGSVTSPNYMMWFTFSVTGNSPVITFSGGALPTAANWMDLYITAIDTMVASPLQILPSMMARPAIEHKETPKDVSTTPTPTPESEVSIKDIKEALQSLKSQASLLELALEKIVK